MGFWSGASGQLGGVLDPKMEDVIQYLTGMAGAVGGLMQSLPEEERAGAFSTWLRDQLGAYSKTRNLGWDIEVSHVKYNKAGIIIASAVNADVSYVNAAFRAGDDLNEFALEEREARRQMFILYQRYGLKGGLLYIRQRVRHTADQEALIAYLKEFARADNLVDLDMADDFYPKNMHDWNNFLTQLRSTLGHELVHYHQRVAHARRGRMMVGSIQPVDCQPEKDETHTARCIARGPDGKPVRVGWGIPFNTAQKDPKHNRAVQRAYLSSDTEIGAYAYNIAVELLGAGLTHCSNPVTPAQREAAPDLSEYAHHFGHRSSTDRRLWRKLVPRINRQIAFITRALRENKRQYVDVYRTAKEKLADRQAARVKTTTTRRGSFDIEF